MYCTIHRLTKQRIETLKADPDYIDELIDELDKDLSISKIIFLILTGGQPNNLYLEKNWHGYHYLLTETAWEGDEPDCYLVKGGSEIGDDMGYGPARLLNPKQVNAFSKALDALSKSDLLGRYNAEKMIAQEIYPSTIWDQAGEKEELVSSFSSLKRFVRKAQKCKEGLLIYIN